MTDFLLLLGKLNLAMGGAILLVWLLRRPLRAQFGAPIAYALWLLVPIAGLASLAPPRVAPPLPAHVMAAQIPATPMLSTPRIASPAPRIAEQLPGQNAPVPSTIAPRATVSDYALPDYATLLFAAWVLGVGVMTLYLARLQARFHAAAEKGEAGPAVVGFLRPRIVMPDGFQEQFTAPEQAAILAHERVHLARQDARINALAALLRSLCWFNPLIHLGASWLRTDQELACDASAMTAQVSRRDYANALLKSQITATALPLGCDWPGSEHPLTERIALLKHKRPGAARRIAGAGLVLFAAAFVGLSAWAAQPPVPAKAVAPPHTQIALATAMPAQIAAPVTSINPVAVPKPAPVAKPVSAVPRSTLSQIQEPDQQIDLALNDAAGAALAKAAADASGSLPDHAVAQQLAANDTTPAPVAPDAVSAMEALSNSRYSAFGGCSPTAIGTVTGVHSDPQLFGTDIVLEDAQLRFPVFNSRRVDNWYIVLVPVGYVQKFPPLDTYVGQKVVIWASMDGVWGMGGVGGRGASQIMRPAQLQLLSTALADPKKTWCFLSPMQRSDPSTADGAAIRPEITQHLQLAQSLTDHFGSYLGAQKQISEAEAVPNQSDAEKQAVAQMKARILGRQPNNRDRSFSDFIDPYMCNGCTGGPPMSSYLPPGDVGRNNPD